MGNPLDYSKLSDEELTALQTHDYSKLSDSTLQALSEDDSHGAPIADVEHEMIPMPKMSAPGVGTGAAIIAGGAKTLKAVKPYLPERLGGAPTGQSSSALQRYLNGSLQSENMKPVPLSRLSQVTGMPVRSTSEIQAAVDAIKAVPGERVPVKKLVDGVEKIVRYDTIPARAAANLESPLVKALPNVGKYIEPVVRHAGNVAKFAQGPLAVGAVVGDVQDVMNRKDTDPTGAVISGIGAAGAAASPWFPPAAGIPAAAAMINYARDNPDYVAKYKNPEWVPKFAGGGLANGGEPNTAPFIGYPNITNKPRDPNFVQQSGPVLGGLDAVLGMGKRDDVSMLTPEGQAYHESYDKYEPVGIAANVLPFIGGPTKALGKATAKHLGPKAADMAENYLTKIGGIAHAVPPDAFAPVKKSGVQLAREANYAHDLVPTHKFTEPQKLSIQDLQGGVLVGVPGDRSLTGHSLMSVNGVPLSKSVQLHGGPRYGQRKADLGEDAFWASQSNAASAIQNKVTNAAERAKGNPVFGMYAAMAPDSSNYALHHTEALVNQLDALNPNKAKLRAFDNMIKEQHPDFLGMNHPEVMNQFAANSDLRKHVADRLNKSKIAAEYGMPSGEATIHAITDPALRNVSTGNTGFSVGEMRPGANLRPELEHPTYDTQIPGQFKGQMIAQLPWQHYFPEAAAKIAANPKQAPHAWGTFKMGDYHQPVTQELVDKISPIEEMLKSATKDFKGYAPGGKVLSALGKSLGEAQAAYKAKFTPGFYHGSPSNSIKAFDTQAERNPNFLTALEEEANDLSPRGFVSLTNNPKFSNDYAVGKNPTVYPVSANLGKHFDPRLPENYELFHKYLKSSPDTFPGVLAPRHSIPKHFREGDWGIMEDPDFIQHLKDKGYNSMTMVENKQPNVGIFNPSDIRGKFAKFNPEHAADPDFMKAKGGKV